MKKGSEIEKEQKKVNERVRGRNREERKKER